MNEALKIFRVIFIAHDESAPGEQSLNLPPPHKTPKRAAILHWPSSIVSVGRDHLGSVIVHQLLVQPVTVIRLVSNQALGYLRHDSLLQGFLHRRHFSWRSTFCPQGERKTMAVCNAHDLGALAPLRFPDQAPPFLAGTKMASKEFAARRVPAGQSACSRAIALQSHCSWTCHVRGRKKARGKSRCSQMRFLNGLLASRQRHTNCILLCVRSVADASRDRLFHIRQEQTKPGRKGFNCSDDGLSPTQHTGPRSRDIVECCFRRERRFLAGSASNSRQSLSKLFLSLLRLPPAQWT